MAEFTGGSPPGPGFTGAGLAVLGFWDEIVSTLTGSGLGGSCLGDSAFAGMLIGGSWTGRDFGSDLAGAVCLWIGTFSRECCLRVFGSGVAW